MSAQRKPRNRREAMAQAKAREQAMAAEQAKALGTAPGAPAVSPMGPPPGRPPRPATPRRIVRRRLMFWLSLVPAIFVLYYGIHLTALNATYARAKAHYDAGEYWDAYEVFRSMRTPNVVEPWKAHFNRGTSAYRYDMLFVAELSLEEAYKLAPEEHRCDVATNLAIVLEASGRHDEERAAEEAEAARVLREAEIARLLGEPYDPDVFELDYEGNEITSVDLFDRAALYEWMAADYFARAAEKINDPSCQTPPSPEASPEEQEEQEQQQEQREQEQERLEEQAQDANEERQQLERESKGDPLEPEPEDGDGGGEQPQDPGDEQGETEEERQAREEAERQEELEQRNEEAGEQAGGGGSEDGEGDGESGEGEGSTGPISNW